MCLSTSRPSKFRLKSVRLSTLRPAISHSNDTNRLISLVSHLIRKKREEMKKAGQYAPTLGNLSDSDKQLDSQATDAANTSADFAGDMGDDLPF